jgi:hypothetical protein
VPGSGPQFLAEEQVSSAVDVLRHFVAERPSEQLSGGLRPAVEDENWCAAFGLVRWLRGGSDRSTIEGCFG